MTVFSKYVKRPFRKYPLIRGMASYAVIWPLSNDCDWWRCARYGLYGSCYVAPTLYTWLTIANNVWPGKSIRLGLIKSFDEAVAEVKVKFWPTYKIGASIWPAVAMFNFCVIPPRNRVPFISGCSLIWTCFLAYMKHLDQEKVPSSHCPPILCHWVYQRPVSYIKILGGRDVSTKVYRIMKWALTDQIAEQYNFYGKRSNKKPFCQLRLRDCVVGK
ncbi:PXMP2/4 family protein 4 [Operophtera brumata]|uniref:PXMP2/4 family protein 4 n=1 Tax=Operophtera brumata TaxID=104452 RepID=A0A0L7L3J9_OPEBR|nr:PXMP2/4 family protein 4 [Operophtera brumata]